MDQEFLEKMEKEYQAKKNLVNFFSLLLKIDKRVNPHLYKKKNNHK